MDIQIIYTSVGVRDFSEEELDRLLAQYSLANKSKLITGMLLYINGKFIQVLEGEADVVDRLLKIIVADKNHTQVNVLVRTPIKQRSFGEWSMGFRRVDSCLAGDHEQFTPFFEKEFDQDSICDDPNLALSVLKTFAYLSL